MSRVLDLFDDPGGEVLKKALGNNDVPGIFKEAAPINAQQVQGLPPRDFALPSMRKFATVDPGHTAISCTYFLETASNLSPEMQKEAADNLLSACQRYGLPYEGFQESLNKLAQAHKEEPKSFCLLGDRYPVSEPDHVKEAEAYFIQEGRMMAPEDRREYCHNLVKFAEAVGEEVGDQAVRRYGSDHLGAQADTLLGVRKSLVPEEARPLLEKFAELMSVTPPDELASAIREYDRETGIDHYYDNHIADPWWTVLGESKEATKVAEFVWEQGPDRVTGTQLVEFGSSHKELLDKQMGEAEGDKFVKDPMGYFKSKPDAIKRMLARMASDDNTQGATSV